MALGSNPALASLQPFLFVFSRYAVLLINIPCPFDTIKGGSVGKGTAVKDKADIDCVVFLNNMNTMKEHKDKLKETKNSLQSCLEQSPFKYQITFHEQTPFAVKFNFRLDLSREFDIDLLPTFTTVKKPGKSSFDPTSIRVHCLSATWRQSPFGQPPCSMLQFIVHNEVYLVAISLFSGNT